MSTTQVHDAQAVVGEPEVAADEFRPSMFYEAPERTMRPVVESTAGIRGNG